MDEELEQIEKNNTLELVPKPKDKNVIGTKWIFKNKLNENGEVTRNKSRLIVCTLKKALYGLKQAPRAWYYHLDKYLRQQGFIKGSTDSNIYIRIDNDKLLILVVYADDIIFGSNEEHTSQNFALVMQKEFEMSMLGELTYFLGLQVQQNKDGIFISKTKYLKQILKKYGMEDSKPVCTLMVTGCSLSANDESAAVHQPTYRSMIGSLLYLTGTRPDIIHAVGIVGRFHANPKEAHLQAVKRVFKYLQGTQNYGLWYPRDTDLTLHAYTDANWAGSMDDRKSTSGGAFFMGPRLVS
eukprot:PITA_33860